MMGRSVYLDQKGETKVKDPVNSENIDPLYNEKVLAAGNEVTIGSSPAFVRYATHAWSHEGVKFEDPSIGDGWQLISWAEIEFYRERYGVKPAADELAEETTLS